MKANELRIGNLVTNEFYESFGDIIKVESIHEGGINVIASDDNKPYGMAQPLLDFEYTFDKLKPIPLTEEWLLRFGFEKTNEHINENHHWVDYLKAGITITMPYFEFDFNNGDSTVEHKTVHQLQNLYFSLTQTELTIKDL